MPNPVFTTTTRPRVTGGFPIVTTHEPDTTNPLNVSHLRYSHWYRGRKPARQPAIGVKPGRIAPSSPGATHHQPIQSMTRPAAYLQAELNSIDSGPQWYTVSKWATFTGCQSEADRLNAKREATWSIIDRGPRYRAVTA